MSETEITIFDIPEIKEEDHKNQRELEYEQFKAKSSIKPYHFELFYEMEKRETSMKEPDSNITSILCKYVLKYCHPIVTNDEKIYSITLQKEEKTEAYIEKMIKIKGGGKKKIKKDKKINEKEDINKNDKADKRESDKVNDKVDNKEDNNKNNKISSQYKPTSISDLDVNFDILLKTKYKKISIPNNQQFRIIGLVIPQTLIKLYDTYVMSYGALVTDNQLITSGFFGLIDFINDKYTQQRESFPHAGELERFIIFENEEQATNKIRNFIKFINFVENYYSQSYPIMFIESTSSEYIDDVEDAVLKKIDYQTDYVEKEQKKILNKMNDIHLGKFYGVFKADIINALEYNDTIYAFYIGKYLGTDNDLFINECEKRIAENNNGKIFERQLFEASSKKLEITKKRIIAYNKFGSDELDDLSDKQKKIIELEYEKIENYKVGKTSPKTKEMQILFSKLSKSLQDIDSTEIKKYLSSIEKELPKSELTGDKILEGGICPHTYYLAKQTLENFGKPWMNTKLRSSLIKTYAIPDDTYGFFCRICGGYLAESNTENIIRFIGNTQGVDTSNDALQISIWKEATYIISTYIRFNTPIPIKPLINSIAVGLRGVIGEHEALLFKGKTNTMSNIKDTLNVYIAIYIYAALCSLMMTNPNKIIFGRDRPDSYKQGKNGNKNYADKGDADGENADKGDADGENADKGDDDKGKMADEAQMEDTYETVADENEPDSEYNKMEQSPYINNGENADNEEGDSQNDELEKDGKNNSKNKDKNKDSAKVVRTAKTAKTVKSSSKKSKTTKSSSKKGGNIGGNIEGNIIEGGNIGEINNNSNSNNNSDNNSNNNINTNSNTDIDTNTDTNTNTNSNNNTNRKYKIGGKVTKDIKYYEKFILSTAIKLILLTKDPIIKRSGNLNEDIVKTIFLNKAYVWARKHTKAIKIDNVAIGKKDSIESTILIDPFYSYTYYALNLMKYSGDIKHVPNFYDVNKVLHKSEKELEDPHEFYENIEVKPWKFAKTETGKLYDDYTFQSYQMELDYVKDKLYLLNVVPVHSQIIEYRKKYANLKQMEKILFSDGQDRIIGTVIDIELKNNIREKYNNFSVINIDFSQFYCPNGERHKTKTYLYAANQHSAGKYKSKSAKARNVEYTREEIKDKFGKIDNWGELKLIDERCGKCGNLIFSSKSGEKDEHSMNKMFKKIDNIIAFYQYYETRCPKGELHNIIDNKCKKCGFDTTFKKSSNKEYYDKYAKIFAEVEKKKDEISVKNLQAISDSFNEAKHIQKQIEQKKHTQHAVKLQNVAEWSTISDIKYNLLINIGLTEGHKYVDIEKSRISPYKSLNDKSNMFSAQALKIKGYILQIIRIYNSVLHYEKIAHYEPAVKEIIDMQKKIFSGKQIPKLPEIGEDFADKEEKFRYSLDTTEYANFLIEYLASMIISIYKSGGDRYKTYSFSLGKYFTKYILDQEKLLSKPEPVFSKIVNEHLSLADSDSEDDNSVNGDSYDFNMSETSSVSSEEEEYSNIIDNNALDVENIDDIYENE